MSATYCELCNAPLAATNRGTICRECAMDSEPKKRKRAFPSCRICGEPVTCGQRDRLGRSIHFGCQLIHLEPEDRKPGLPDHESHGRRPTGRRRRTA
jgi:hypothetical protein